MRFNLNLEHISGNLEIPFNYKYLLSGAIYGILSRADGEYASFLHEQGYRINNKTFKLFTFSDLRCSFKPNGDRMRLVSKDVSLTVSFHLPQAAETFIKGLFLEQDVSLFDRKSKAVFHISQVESMASPFNGKDSSEITEYPFTLLSPVLVSKKDIKGRHQYLSPLDADFIPILLANWRSKFAAIYGGDKAEYDFQDSSAAVIFDYGAPKSRLIRVKANSQEETSLKTWYNFKLKLKGTNEALEVVYDCGVGSYNSLGMGCVGYVKP